MAGSSLSVLTILSMFILFVGIKAGPHEVRLLNDLMENYNSNERPSEIDNEPLKVEFQITLQQIIDVAEKNQMITTNIWLSMKWNDYKLRWDPAKYGNVSEIRMPMKYLWKPDILMYNSADPSFDGSWPVNMVVYSDGTTSQLPPGIFTSACPINIRWFPFDVQSCKLKFGSWTYDGTKIDLQIADGLTEGSTDGYSRSGEWDLIGLPGVRNVVVYECCPDNPYIDLTFSINIRRRLLYYLINIIAPCIMLALLTLLTFTIPADAGEKISFAVTILLSLSVFQLLVADALPATSDAIPLIAVYFSAVMMMNALSVVFSVLVLSYHHRSAETHFMPKFVKKTVCQWMAWLLCMRRPGHEFKSRTLFAGGSSTDKEVEMITHNQSSKSLLANVANGDEYSPSLPRSPNLNGTDFTKYKMKIDARSISSEYSPTRHELRYILKELRFITDKMKAQDEDDGVSSDWKFAAAVIDRFLLWFFACFTVICTISILSSAPNLFNPAPAIAPLDE